MTAYLSCAGIITLLSFRAVFFIYAAFLFITSVIWAFSSGKIVISAQSINQVPPSGNDEIKLSDTLQSLHTKEKLGFFGGKRAPGIAIILFCLILVSQGALRDGLMAWIPAYISGVFSFPANTAILFAGIIPLVNLIGIYLCRIIFIHVKDEGKCTIYFFIATLCAALLLRFFGAAHISVSLIAFAVIIACMMGVNLMLVTFVPTQFLRFGLVSFMTGLTNSMVYAGSSISNFGIALVLEKTGWDKLLGLISIIALASIVLCLFAAPRWASFAGYKGYQNIQKKYADNTK